MHIMVENTDPKDREKLVSELTGPFRTMGDKIKPDEIDAPAWWHGEEEAFQATEAALGRLPRRRR
jgi:hypothetical protein